MEALEPEQRMNVPTRARPLLRRLRAKTSVIGVARRIDPEASEAVCEEGCTKVQLSACDLKIVNSMYHAWWRKIERFHKKSARCKQKLKEKYKLRDMTEDARLKSLRKFQAHYPGRKDMIEAYIGQMRARSKRKQEVSRKVQCSRSFWTWQGSWGDIDLQTLSSEGVRDALIVRPHSEEQAAALAKMDQQVLCLPSKKPSAWQCGDPEADMKSADIMAKMVVRHAQVLAIVNELNKIVDTLKQTLPVQHCAWSVEMCTDAWKRTCRLKVHAHMAVVYHHKTRVPQHDCRTLLGSKPHQSGGIALASFSRGRNMSSALYYCQASKVGRIASWGTHEPFVGYAVHPLWIFSLVQSGKMCYANARADMCRVPMGLVRNLECLDNWQQERNRMAIHAVSVQCAQAAIRDMRPWKEYAMVNLWEAQYAQSRLRYGFLVLDGPSRMGKTQFARNLSQAPGGVLEINMAGCAKVDLRLYDPLVHDVLLFDECDPQAVLEHKKLFQAGGAGISMQTSATNMHAFSVCVSQKKIVVCSNNWWGSCMKLPWEDAEWLRANSYYLHVTSPMWSEEGDIALPVTDEV